MQRGQTARLLYGFVADSFAAPGPSNQPHLLSVDNRLNPRWRYKLGEQH
jgi:hypothetical protein